MEITPQKIRTSRAPSQTTTLSTSRDPDSSQFDTFMPSTDGSSRWSSHDQSIDTSVDLPSRSFAPPLASTPSTKKSTFFDFNTLQRVVNNLQLPSSMWGTHSTPGTVLAYTKMNNSFMIDLKVIFDKPLVPKIFANERQINFPCTVTNKSDVESLLRRISQWKICIGYTEPDCRESKWDDKCTGFVPRSFGRPFVRCEHCNSKKKALKRMSNSRKSSDESSVIQMRNKLRNLRKVGIRSKKKVASLKSSLKTMREKLAKVPQKKIDEIIATVPDEQKELVRSVFQCANRTLTGRRYTIEWIYECLLMKIKSPALYKKLRRENKLPLPSPRTLNRYIRKLKPEWGFQENTFSLLKEKSPLIPESDRHGTLLLDEMALTEKVHFEGDSLLVHGLVNLGKYTPEDDKSKRGDHALVLMFQPFRGQWVQAIGAFLSAGAVKGPILQKLVLEATILLANAGFYVDCVTTDAASWNRSMWSLFGISKNQNSCEHPCDSRRQLYFASDFPHLMKRLWTRVVNKKVLELPEGQVKLSHYEAVVRLEEGKGLRSAFPLTRDHLNPTNYQRMNVRMAMQFFSNTVATAMLDYKLRNKEGLADSQPTIDFMRRMNSVVEAMNSRNAADALRPNEEAVQQKVLKDFLDYLKIMDDMAQAKARLIKEKKVLAENFQRQKENLPPKTFKPREVPENKVSVGHIDEITSNTYLGLIVTVKTALDLIQYLHENLNYQYIMTRRLNQDALEHFFGQLRYACGSSDHPDPKMFIEVYRLLTTYSLVKPPKGSDVTGGDMLGSLLQLRDVIGEGNLEKKKELEQKIDEIIDGEIPFDEYDIITTDVQACEKDIDSHTLTYFGGYICRKARQMEPAKSCLLCFEALHAPPERRNLEREQLIDIRTYGGLLKPSDNLYELIMQLEQAVVKTAGETHMHTMLLFDTLDKLTGVEVQRVGCEAHSKAMTASVITFYMMCRMHFVCADANKVYAETKRRKRDLAKQAKLS